MKLTDEHKGILENLREMETIGHLDKAYLDDVPIEVYHHPSCPGLSSTRLKQVLRNDYTEINDTEALRFGRAFHAFILEPHLFAQQYEVGAGIMSTKQFISFDDYHKLQAMKKALEAHPRYDELFTGGASERTFWSRDLVTGVLKKCRTDRINGIRVSDIKTTDNASESEFLRSARKYGYGISAVYYLEIVSEVLGEYTSDFNIIAVEKKKDPKIGIYRPNIQCIDRRSLEIREALETYQLEQQMKYKPWIGSSPEIREVWL